jgi:hypothetical protein
MSHIGAHLTIAQVRNRPTIVRVDLGGKEPSPKRCPGCGQADNQIVLPFTQREDIRATRRAEERRYLRVAHGFTDSDAFAVDKSRRTSGADQLEHDLPRARAHDPRLQIRRRRIFTS